MCSVYPERSRTILTNAANWYLRKMKTQSLLSSAVLFFFCLNPAECEWRFTGPFGGSADLIRVARSNSSHVLVAARNGLIYNSTDAGASWRRIRFPGEHGSVLHALEIDPIDEKRWYAGVEDDSARISGVYLTVDSGQTWSRLEGTTGKAIWSIAVWAGDPSVVVAGAADGVYRSSDRGETWARISPEINKALQPVVALALDAANPEIIYAGTTHLPWRTEDGGKSWRSIHSGMLDDSDVFSIVIHPERPGIIYASACSGAYRSANSAQLWSRLPTPRGTFRTYVVAVDHEVPTTVFAGTSAGLMRSEDEGKTWKKISSHVVRSIDFERKKGGRIYFASSTAGVLISSNRGNTVAESNPGFVNRTWAALTGVKGVLYASSVQDASGGLFRSEDGGTSWDRISGPETARGEGFQFVAPSPDSRLTLFGATRSNVWRSSDGGKRWTVLPGTPTGQVLALSFGPSRAAGLYLATSSGLHRSRDNGLTWKSVAMPFKDPLRSAQVSSTALLAVSGSSMALSRDAGETWYVCGKPPAAVDWYGYTVTPQSHAVVAATSHGILRSTDECKTWSFVRSGIEGSTVMNVVSHPSRPEMFAVQRGRLFRSTDDGASWQAFSSGKGSESTPTALGIFADSPDDVFALFRRTGVAQWKLNTPVQAGSGEVLNSTSQTAQ